MIRGTYTKCDIFVWSREQNLLCARYVPKHLCLFATPERMEIMYGSSKYGHPCNIGSFTHNFVAYWCSSLHSAMAVSDTLFHNIVVHFNVVVTVCCTQVVFACLTFCCVQKSSRSSSADVPWNRFVAFLPVLHLSTFSNGFSSYLSPSSKTNVSTSECCLHHKRPRA